MLHRGMAAQMQADLLKKRRLHLVKGAERCLKLVHRVGRAGDPVNLDAVAGVEHRKFAQAGEGLQGRLQFVQFGAGQRQLFAELNRSGVMGRPRAGKAWEPGRSCSGARRRRHRRYRMAAGVDHGKGDQGRGEQRHADPGQALRNQSARKAENHGRRVREPDSGGHQQFRRVDAGEILDPVDGASPSDHVISTTPTTSNRRLI